ncbi:hypothetical protein LCGC14_0353200 [marine sediment metagenome]|uniref:Uncharacterized protein n=1 Tax=marine sediment metagenome TaxID=412755 RepID=A0A0F9WI47_9ZZZZ
MTSSFETKLRTQLDLRTQLYNWSVMFYFSETEVEETFRALTTLDQHVKPVPFDYAFSIIPNILYDARHNNQSPIDIAIRFRRRSL